MSGPPPPGPVARSIEDDWLWGWDPTPGIVSVWANHDGQATVWRRVGGELVRDDVRFRPWLVVTDIDGIDAIDSGVTTFELAGEGELRFVVRADDGRTLTNAVLRAATRRLGTVVTSLRALGDSVIALPPEEQYLVATGRTYFKDLGFDDLRRMQIDLETTGLDAERDRIFLVAIRDPAGHVELVEGDDEAALIRTVVARIAEHDPDVIENHNLHGFDLPFLDRRARIVGVPLQLGRIGPPGLRQRAARRGFAGDVDPERKFRFTVPGRELIDTLDAVIRYDFSTRELSGHGLKNVARHLGLAAQDREHVPGARVHEVYIADRERVRRYATDDVEEVAGVAHMLGGAAFALAKMAPRRYERLSDAGAATGVIDPLLVRAYLRSGQALPLHRSGDGTEHQGAGLHLFATGVAHRIVKADVASLYPSLMREYGIGPARDRLGALLAIVSRLTDRRLAAKAAARAAPPGSTERHTHEAMSAAMKIVINSAYGYLGAAGLTRFSDVHAANEVTRRGREVLDLLCRELAARGGTLLEADTDGVYFAVPASWTAADEARVVSEVAELLPARVKLELDGRYAAMLSHEPKNYALLGYDGGLVLRGVAFRSSRAEPFGEQFLRAAIGRLLVGDVAGVRETFVDTVVALRRRAIATAAVSARVRLTKAPADYTQARDDRRELAYEALLAAGRTSWTVGEHVRVYRARAGRAGLVDDDTDPRDYDVDHYVRVLRDTFASRLARAFAPGDFTELFDDPEQPSLFAPSYTAMHTVLTPLAIGGTDPAENPSSA